MHCRAPCPTPVSRESACVHAWSGPPFYAALHAPHVDRFISSKMRRGELHTPKGYVHLLKELRPASLVFDLGANIGATSLPAAALGYSVVAVEPLPANADLLEHAVAANCNFSITVLRTALGERPSRLAHMAVAGSSPAASTMGDTSLLAHDFKFNASSPPVAVAVESGDRVLLPRLHAHQGPWAMKMDVEGFELHALRGMPRLLSLAASARPPQWLALEFFPHMLRAAGSEPADLLHFLDENGFDCGIGMLGGADRNGGGGAIAADLERYKYVAGIRRLQHIDLTCRHRVMLAHATQRAVCRGRGCEEKP